MDTHPNYTPLVEPKPTTRRHRYSKVQKRQIVEECLAGRESVSKIARRYDINANLLFKWRRQYEAGVSGNEVATPALIPIVMAPPAQTCPPESTHPKAAATIDKSTLEVHFASGHRLVVTGAVCPIALRAALEVLSR